MAARQAACGPVASVEFQPASRRQGVRLATLSTSMAALRPTRENTLSMTTEHIDGVRVATQASVYFDGKCVSHSLTLPDGTRKSVGVVLPSTLTFGTAAPEIMECTGGSCDYRLAGSDAWLRCNAGESFRIGANSKFDIRVADAFHYICHYG